MTLQEKISECSPVLCDLFRGIGQLIFLTGLCSVLVLTAIADARAEQQGNEFAAEVEEDIVCPLEFEDFIAETEDFIDGDTFTPMQCSIIAACLVYYGSEGGLTKYEMLMIESWWVSCLFSHQNPQNNKSLELKDSSLNHSPLKKK